MTIEVGLTDSFRLELLRGEHNFDEDAFKISLYTGKADLLATTTAYKASYEVSGTGYTAGGQTVTVVSTSIHNGVAVVEFGDVTWAGADFTARSGLLYNVTNSNASVCVIDFGLDTSGTTSDFKIIMPSATSNEALVRLTRG